MTATIIILGIFFYALGLLDSDEEREYKNEMDENEPTYQDNSQFWEEVNSSNRYPYLYYALGIGDCPSDSENETSESDESDEMESNSDDDSEVSDENNSEQN